MTQGLKDKILRLKANADHAQNKQMAVVLFCEVRLTDTKSFDFAFYHGILHHGKPQPEPVLVNTHTHIFVSTKRPREKVHEHALKEQGSTAAGKQTNVSVTHLHARMRRSAYDFLCRNPTLKMISRVFD